MYEIMNSDAITVIIIVASIMVTPLYVFATYVFSGASATKGMQIGIGFLVFGALMFWVCLTDLPRRLGLIGNLFVPLAWTLPSLILYWQRDWFLSLKLSQNWLVGLQLFRAIGGVFLLENSIGNIPGIFAYPAGIGDLIVALVALFVLLKFGCKEQLPGSAILLVIFIGVADFISAFFFGFTSSESPVQIFFPDIPNKVIVFPTGMIPLFLVPYAIFFHMLSAINYFKYPLSGTFKKYGLN